MTRPVRILAPGLTYHVTQRGTGPSIFFRDSRDRARCVDLLAFVVSSCGWDCLAYSLLDTHLHLLVTTPEPNLDRGMKHLNGVYAQGFNHRHGRIGHLVQDRYHAVIVEREAHLRETIRYIALNPVRAGLCRRPELWAWSSYPTILGLASAPFVATEQVLRLFGRTPRSARAQLRAFVDESSPSRDGV
jgi:REP element-mobilizing transposase RayT